MTQHILIIWMATAVAAFSGLVGCTIKGAASSAPGSRTAEVTRVQLALDNTLRAVGLLVPKDGWVVRIALAARHAVLTHLGDSARIEFDAWPGRTFAGRVSNISSADSDADTFTVEVQIDAGGARFAQGLLASVELTPQGEFTPQGAG